jgi:hypothetical protein
MKQDYKFFDYKYFIKSKGKCYKSIYEIGLDFCKSKCIFKSRINCKRDYEYRYNTSKQILKLEYLNKLLRKLI